MDGKEMEARERVIVAGPNGAGKTTLAQGLLLNKSYRYLSADLIAAELDPGEPNRVQVRAAREFFHQLADALSVDRFLLIESTLSGRGMIRILERARAQGFTVFLTFAFVGSDDACVQRVRERVRKGGHDVPEIDIRRRFHRSAHNFWRHYRQIADEWLIIYNGTQDFQDVAFGDEEGLTIRDETLFQQFLNIAGDENGTLLSKA